MYKSKQLESLFVEVVGDPKPLVGIVYHHPCMNEKSFNEEFLKQLNQKILSETNITSLVAISTLT